MASYGDKHTVHWFRKGLRLHDNPSLREGLKAATTFRCVFIIDPWFAGSSNVGINKWRFLLQCLEDLDRNLKKLNSRLFVIRGQPADALPKLFKEWGTTSLTFEEDPEPFGRVRDHNITAMCKEIGISVVSRVSHTLYKLDSIIEKNGGRAPLTYHQFQTIIAGMDAPSLAETKITLSNIGNATTPVNDDHDEKYGVPTLEELGFDTEGLQSPIWIGGESEALTRLERHLERKAWVASFGRPKMTPQSLLASQTGLSPYLRFGCLSTRLFYYQLTDLYKKIKKTRPPLSLHGQLLWREFFYCAATKNPNFDKMVGNPICVQIPWDKNNEALAKWANGQTGYPWIDAIMIQLREEGWIHHLARHAVACFLTRGDLWISWEEGMKVFEELLLDADWSVNAGTWMWLSCSSFFQQFFHCYCPVRFGRKADPYGDYIRKYIPALRNFPTKHIHAPWLAPIEVQESTCCIIGRDYPLPIVDHTTAARANIQRIKQVYRKLAKYKPLNDDMGKNNLIHSLIVDNLNRSNMPESSPSPNTVITNVNHSNYLCSLTQDQKSNEQNHDNENDNREMYSNYEASKNLSDIFENNQYRNNTGLQIRNIPYKKIVVIEQNYEAIKQEHIPNEEVKKSIEMYGNSGNVIYENINHHSENFDDLGNHSKKNVHDSQHYYPKMSLDVQTEEDSFQFSSANKSQNDRFNINTNANNSYDIHRKSFYYTKFEAVKTSLALEQNYGIQNNDMKESNLIEDNKNEFANSSEQNYDGNLSNFPLQNLNMYHTNNTLVNYNEQINQGKVDGNLKNHEYGKEQLHYQQGNSTPMHGCSRPNQ